MQSRVEQKNLPGCPGSAPVQMSQEAVDVFAARTHDWPVLNLLPARTPRDLSAELLLNVLVPCLWCCQSLFILRGRILYLSLLKFISFLLFLSTSLSGSL